MKASFVFAPNVRDDGMIFNFLNLFDLLVEIENDCAVPHSLGGENVRLTYTVTSLRCASTCEVFCSQCEI